MPRPIRRAPALARATFPGEEGPVHVAVSATGIVAAARGGPPEVLEDALIRRFGFLPESDAAARRRLDALRPAIEALVAGTALDVTEVPVDLRDRAPFDQLVLAAVREVPWGETASYGEIARRAGTPRASRAVGGAISRNPIALFVPCHRVIAADGTLGGYGGDGPSERVAALEHKRRLLLREGVTVRVRAD